MPETVGTTPDRVALPHAARPTYAPKVPLEWIVRLYRRDAVGLRDDELVDKVGWRLQARCQDVLMVTASRVACPLCQTEFPVPWIGQPPERVPTCPQCGWQITAAAFHASIRHRDLSGHAPTAFTAFVTRFPQATSYAERMRLIDRVVHALHVSGGVTARNVLEGPPRRVLALLDELAGAAHGQATATNEPS
jgi:hypothetical protein